PPEIYALEAFASTDPALGEHGVVFVKFSLAQGGTGTIAAVVEDKTPLKYAEGKITDDTGNVVALADGNWKWERNRLVAKITTKNAATLAIATKPLPAQTAAAVKLDYQAQRDACAATWKKILGGAMNVETPEPLVNNAWRHLLIQNFELINGDRMFYSAGN